MSKCSSCDQHGAFLYYSEYDDTYCPSCYEERRQQDDCECIEGIKHLICHHCQMREWESSQ